MQLAMCREHNTFNQPLNNQQCKQHKFNSHQCGSHKVNNQQYNQHKLNNQQYNQHKLNSLQHNYHKSQQQWRHMCTGILRRFRFSPSVERNRHTIMTWRTAFNVCVDQQPISPELKLLQLRQYLSGPLLGTVETYGYSASAYTTALKRLDQKYGGERRKTAVHTMALSNLPAIREKGTAAELERLLTCYKLPSSILKMPVVEMN